MPAGAPTVFLVVHLGFIARSLLETDIVVALKEAGVRIVILAPEPATAHLREAFGGEQVVVEALRKPQKRAGRRSQVGWWTLPLRNYAIANGHRTRALREKAERFPERYMEGQPVEQRV